LASRGQVHYEVFARRHPTSEWSLAQAGEDRDRALEAAEAMLRHGDACAVRVTRETLDAETRQFRSFPILEKGSLRRERRGRPAPVAVEPPCVEPSDLYSVHARERIGRLLESWLARRRVTPFELLHRPDLAEELEASGLDLQHALQKVAIPEAEHTGAPVHSVIRAYRPLVDRTVSRVIQDGRKGLFPDLRSERFDAVCVRLARDPQREYRLGGAVSGKLAAARNWSSKIDCLLELAREAPAEEPLRGWALSILETPLAEILASRAGLADLLGPALDLGASLAALARLSSSASVEALLRMAPELKGRFPSLGGAAERLSTWFEKGAFEAVRVVIGHRILSELTSPRRLRPGDPDGEIEILRALAMALTASADLNLTLDDIGGAFVERSRRLVSPDFIEDFLSRRSSALDEARGLIWLADNVAGGANKRAASRWLSACVCSLRFEMEVRSGPDAPTAKLEMLAGLQSGVIKSGLTDVDGQAAMRRLGEVGGWVDADANLIAALSRSSAPVAPRLSLLLRLASGTAGPLGPAADRARAEAQRLLRQEPVRLELASDPEAAERVRALLDAAPLAA
jgi:hypothetical protein